MSIDVLIKRAQAAEHAGQWEKAYHSWADIRERASGQAIGHYSSARALIHLGRMKEAETVLIAAQQHLPPDLWISFTWAELAHITNDLNAALERFYRVHELFPDHPQGMNGVVGVLIDLRQLDQAERISQKLVEAFPSEEWVAHRHALIPSVRRHWTEAIRRWEGVCSRFPKHEPGFLHLSDALIFSGGLIDADAILREGAERFPANVELAVRWARVGHSTAEPEQSPYRWRDVRRRFPNNRDVYLYEANRWMGLGNRQEAAQVLTDAMSIFPENSEIAERRDEIALFYNRAIEPKGPWVAPPQSQNSRGVGHPQNTSVSRPENDAQGRVALAVPTWRGHFPLVREMLRSIHEHCKKEELPSLIIAVSDLEEKDDLTSLLRHDLGPSASEGISIIEMGRYKYIAEHVEPKQHLPNSLREFAIKCTMINFKKYSLVVSGLDAGCDKVIIVDSETRMFRSGNLHKALASLSLRHQYRYRSHVNRNSWISQVQRASVSSVWPSISENHFINNVYSWFDELCVYDKAAFAQFSDYVVDRLELQWTAAERIPDDELALNLSLRLLPCSFEWISYVAFALLRGDVPYRLTNLDDVLHLFSAAGDSAPDNAGYTENLWRLMERHGLDWRFLQSYDPPWVPYTTDKLFRRMIESYLPEEVCLMYHYDRI